MLLKSPNLNPSIKAPWQFEQIESFTFEGTYQADWYQGKGVFGGVVAASFMDAFLKALQDEPQRKPRSLTVHFMVAPQNQKTQIKVQVEKQGRFVSFVTGRMYQNGEVVALATVTMAQNRDKSNQPHVEVLEILPKSAPDYPPPEKVFEVPIDMPMMPTYCKYVSYRFCGDVVPYSGSKIPIVGGYAKFRENYEFGYPYLCAILDVWPPAFFSCLTRPSVAATVDLSYHFYDQQPQALDIPLIYQGEILGMKDGYADEKGFLWDLYGRPIASARQLIALG